MKSTHRTIRAAPAGVHPETSVFLDLIRFCAALVVAFDHLANYTKNLFWQFGAFGAPEFACSARPLPPPRYEMIH